MVAPAPRAAFAPGQAANLIERLASLLKADDAQADQVLLKLQSVLAGAGHDAVLASIRKAVDEIEYQNALAPLTQLAQAIKDEAGVL
jgi:hypothetical protein